VSKKKMGADYVDGSSSLASSKWQCMMETNSYKQELGRLRMAVEGFSHLLERQADKYNKVTRRYKKDRYLISKNREKSRESLYKFQENVFKFYKFQEKMDAIRRLALRLSKSEELNRTYRETCNCLKDTSFGHADKF
jgi:hypothetical protein